MKRARRTPLNKNLPIHNKNGTPWNPEHRLDLNLLKDSLRWSFEYHLEEHAQRLKEIGGLGTGGIELEYVPFKGVDIVDTTEKQKRHALGQGMFRMWSESSWSYVQGQFRACILLAAATVERAFKNELESRNISCNRKDMTLGKCITECKKCGILPNNHDDEIVKAALFVKNARDDVTHANLELQKPHEFLTGSSPAHKKIPMADMPDKIRKCVVSENGKMSYMHPTEEAQTVMLYEYKALAESTRLNAKRVLQYLYKDVQPIGDTTSYQVLPCSARRRTSRRK
ncbi:MAG: hypothetical protein WC562_03850 [Dehalococcoidia bacterium]